MSSDPRITSFFVCIDIVQGCLDFNEFCDFMKANYKKEIIIVNAQDFVEKDSVRSSKSDGKGISHQKSDGILQMIASMKAKIDTDLAKTLEAMKKQIASLEKAREQGKSRQSKQRSRSPLSDDGKERPTPFSGEIDLLFIIINFPYLPSQLSSLVTNGIDLSAFISFVPSKTVQYAPYIYKPIERSSRGGIRKPQISGSELDYQQNPQAYPPPRWMALRPAANPSIAFAEIVPSESMESTFHQFETEILKVFRDRPQFLEATNSTKFVQIPCSKTNADAHDFIKFLCDPAPRDIAQAEERSKDYSNSIIHVLKDAKWGVTPVQPPLKKSDYYSNLFDQSEADLSRHCANVPIIDKYDPLFQFKIPPVLLQTLYPILHWQITEEIAAACCCVKKFISNPSNFYAYAGQKFEALINSTNKALSLGLPLAFFDWQQWTFMAEESLENLIGAFSFPITRTLFDNDSGILFILSLMPVPRTSNQNITSSYIPICFENISDWMEHESEEIGETKVFRLPSKISDSTVVSSFAAMSMRINIENEDGYQFYKGHYGTDFSVLNTKDSVVIHPTDGVVVTAQDGVAMLFLNESIYYNGSCLILKSAAKDPIIINMDGSLLMKDILGNPMTLLPNGTVGHFSEEKWVYSDTNTTKLASKVMKRSELIRNDGIKFYIMDDGSRRIEFFRESASLSAKSVIADEFKEDEAGHPVESFEDFFVEQKNGEIEYIIPGFPAILFKDSVISIKIGQLNFLYGNQKVEMKANGYSLSVNSKWEVSIEFPKFSAFCTASRLEYKESQSVLLIDSNGSKVTGVILSGEPPKKKNCVFDSKWGKVLEAKENYSEQQRLDTLRKFTPRLFAIRSDLSVVEFLRPDLFSSDDSAIELQGSVNHPSGEKITVVTRHQTSLFPGIYISHPPLTKQARASILSGLHIPKRKKKSDDSLKLTEARKAEADFCSASSVFISQLSECLDSAILQYNASLSPEEEPPEVKTFLPPQTPHPRLLFAQQNLYSEMDKKKIAYWGSHESDFGFPMNEKHEKPRPISPRVKLFDPPRCSKKEEDPYPELTDGARCKPERPNTSRRTAPESPKFLEWNSKSFEFGSLKKSEKKVASITVSNFGPKSIHYSLSTKGNDNIEVLTKPGVIIPAMQAELKVRLCGSLPPGEVNSCIQFQSVAFSFPIPIHAYIRE